MAEYIDELIPFLRHEEELIRLNSSNMVAGLSADKDGMDLVIKDHRVIEAVLQLTKDEHPTIANHAYSTLINCSVNETFSLQLISKYDIVPTFVSHVLDKQSTLSDKACMLLSNVSRTPGAASTLVNCMEKINENWIDELLTVFNTVKYNTKDCKLDYLASFFANLMQLAKVRKLILNEKKDYMKKLVTFIKEGNSSIRRGGVASIIKNSCFQFEHHEWLMCGEVDLLTHLLLPLCGGEEYNDDEMDKMPIDLQYLDNDKIRERDPDIRKLLVECVLMLCAEKKGREMMRSMNIHLIIDNLVKFEASHGNPDVHKSAEDLCQLLVSVETDVDNLMT